MSNTIESSEVDFQEASELESFDSEVAARELLAYAVDCGASDVFITDQSSYVSIQMRRLGRVEPVQRLSREAGRRLQNHFRAVGGADVTDHMKPVEGREQIAIDETRVVDVRISALPSVLGQDLSLRVFPSDHSLMTIDELGFLSHEVTAVRDLLGSSCGLLLVAGPTGSGKTNSMYAFLRHLNDGQRKIHTLEEPVEYTIPGIVQSQVNVRAGVDYHQLLSAVLRHSPDVIMIGEIRDRRTAEIAVRAGGSGQFVIATIHARSAVGALQTLRAYGIHPHFIAGSLIGVVAQRLLRHPCSKCRRAVDLSSYPAVLGDIRQMLEANSEPRLVAATGCDQCTDGFDRLTCMPEILRINSQIRGAIADGLDADRLEQLGYRHGRLDFRTAAQLRLALGLTTIEEVIGALPNEGRSIESPVAENDAHEMLSQVASENLDRSTTA